MKNTLLILLALLVTPAWAADAPPAPAEPKPTTQTTPAAPDSTTTSCPTGCTYMACPPPNGAPACCHKVGAVYQVCT